MFHTTSFTFSSYCTFTTLHSPSCSVPLAPASSPGSFTFSCLHLPLSLIISTTSPTLFLSPYPITFRALTCFFSSLPTFTSSLFLHLLYCTHLPCASNSASSPISYAPRFLFTPSCLFLSFFYPLLPPQSSPKCLVLHSLAFFRSLLFLLLGL